MHIYEVEVCIVADRAIVRHIHKNLASLPRLAFVRLPSYTAQFKKVPFGAS